MPTGRGRKGAVPPRVRKTKQPITTRIEMGVSNNTTSTTSFEQSAITITPSFHFSLTAMASQYNVMQSPFCSNQQMFQPRYSGHHDRGMHGYATFPPPFYQYLPHAPPVPLLPPPTLLPQCQPSSPFVLCFISGNISSCFGCKVKYTKSLPPPSDL